LKFGSSAWQKLDLLSVTISLFCVKNINHQFCSFILVLPALHSSDKHIFIVHGANV
jgi:hypothetical protein